MKKRMKTPLKILIGLIVILSLVAVFLIYHSSITDSNKPLAVSGYSALSISNVEYDGTSKIRVYGVANGAEQLLIDFTPAEMNQYLADDGVYVTNSVTGSITLEKQLKNFPITKNTNENYYTIAVAEVGLLVDCATNVPSGYTLMGSIGTSSLLKKACAYYAGIGTNSVFTGQSIRESSIAFNIGGATGTLSPSDGTNTLTLNDGKTKVEWVGDLSNYNQISSPYQYAILFKNSAYSSLISSNSYVLSKDKANEWLSCIGASTQNGNTLSILMGGIIGYFFSQPSYSKVSSCTTTYNNGISSLLTNYIQTYRNSINAEGAVFTSNALQVDLKTADSFPTFIITLDATKVGIQSLKGTPSILNCITKQSINSGDMENPALTVKNVGTSAGSFMGSISCTGTATVSGYITEKLFSAGETANMPVTITGQNTIADTTKSANCVVTITDRKGGGTATCSFTTDVTYQSGLICSPSSVKCVDSKTLRTCSPDGRTFSDAKCNNTCLILGDGTSQCSGGANQTILKSCSDCDAYAKNILLGWMIPSTTCAKKTFQGTILTGFCAFAFVKLIAVPLFFIIVFIFGLNIFPAMLKGKYPALSWIFSLVSAFLIALLTYFIFYLGLALAIFYLIIRVGIKFTPLGRFMK